MFGWMRALARDEVSLGFHFEPCSVVVLNLTLQFLDPVNREALLGHIYQVLLPGSVLILVEKVVFDSAEMNHFFREAYFLYKKGQGYSYEETLIRRGPKRSFLRRRS